VFRVTADDNGTPQSQKSSVIVTINVHEKRQSAPQWQDTADCPLQVFVDENVQVSVVYII
jgi:hypothetical protein